MKFSVIVPHFNRFDRLTMMFWRLKNQTCWDFEVILVDGGSNSEDLNTFTEIWKDQLQLIVLNTNVGHWENPARARNVGYRWACGEFSVMLDADYLPCFFMLEEFEKYHMLGHDYVWGYAIDTSEGLFVPNNDHVKSLQDMIVFKYDIGARQELPLYMCPLEDIMYMCNIPNDKWNKEPWLFSLKTSIMRQIRGYDEDFIGWGKEDSDMFVRLTAGLGLSPAKNGKASVIHIHHASAGPNGIRDSRYNTKLLLDKSNGLPDNVVRNNKEWGQTPSLCIMHNYRNK